MPWKTSSAMEERARFVFEYERDEANDDGALVRTSGSLASVAIAGCAVTGSMALRVWLNWTGECYPASQPDGGCD